MQKRTLGKSGMQVSEIGLGAMTWGSQNTEAEAHAQIDAALDRGVDFMDTAEMYPVAPVRQMGPMPKSCPRTWNRGAPWTMTFSSGVTSGALIFNWVWNEFR